MKHSISFLGSVYVMSPSSDSDDSSDDSDKGIRYKTDSIRNKKDLVSSTRNQLYKKRRHSRRRTKHASSDEEEYKRYKRKKERRHKKGIRCDKVRQRKDIKKVTPSVDSSQSKIQISAAMPHSFKATDQDDIGNTTNISAIISSETEKEGHSQVESSLESSFGPALPPHLLKKDSNSLSHWNKSVDVVGPILSSRSINLGCLDLSKEGCPEIIGPTLPLHMQKSNKELHNTVHNISPESPEITKASPSDVIGPSLPQPSQTTTNTEDKEQESSFEKVIGPILPPHLRQQLADASPSGLQQDNDEDDSFGPLPMGTTLSKSHLELEERAWQLKIDQLNPQGDGEPRREEWMLELPAVRAEKLGLGPRTFRMKAGPDFSDR